MGSARIVSFIHLKVVPCDAACLCQDAEAWRHGVGHDG